VAIGSDVEVVGTARPRLSNFGIPGSATLEWTGGDRAVHRAAMTADQAQASSTRTFRLTVPRLAESIGYRVVVDSEASRRHAITAIEPPAVASVSAKLEPPSYTKLRASTAKNPARIEAWEGSRVTIAMTANQPLKSARLEWPAIGEVHSSGRASTSIVPLESRDGLTWTATVPAVASGNYGFAMEESHGLKNRPEPARRLVVKPDMPPTVALGGAGGDREAQADDLLVVDVLARDDLGVNTTEMLYAIDRAKGSSGPEDGEKAAVLDGLGTTRARGEASLGLKSLSLKAGDIVTYRIRVTDTRPEPKGPNVTVSPPRVLRIVDKAEPLLAREQAIARQSLQDQLTEIKKIAAENRQGAEALRYAADAAQRGNGKWDREKQADLAAREGSARSVVEKLQVLSHDFAESGQFASLSRPARQIADVEAEAGRETLASARQSADGAKRLTQLRAADDRLASVQVRLDELQRRFDELARLDDDRRKLRELAEKQDELAKKADEAAETGDRGTLEKLQQEQDQLRWQADELARRSPELMAEALAARAKEAEDLAKLARELAERQREEARKTADPSGRELQLKALAEAQRRIEDAARRLALKVDRPLEENSRGRLDAAAMSRPIEPIERGEIEAGRQKLNEAEDALRRLARDLDDVRDDPKALARRLARRQDVLNNQVAEVVREAHDPDQKAALAEKLKPFAAREEAIGKLAARLPVPDELKNLAREAVESIDRSKNDLNNNKHEHVQNHQNEARDRLSRLAEALPDLNQGRQQMVQALNEAKGRTNSVANELDNHLRETAPRADQRDFDPEAAARELARRVAPLADRQAEAVRHLAAVTPDAQVAPQHQRALQRARNLADTLDQLRESAPPESRPSEAKPQADWRILGPFDDARKLPPFAIDKPIDLKAAYNGHKGSHPTWRDVHSGPDGLIDLGAMYSQDQNQSAYGYAEITSPAKGKGRLVIGSDDNITIWLNGKRVFEFNNSRSYAPAQDRAEVTFEQGINRLLVLCGNGSDQWKFSVAAQPPPPADLARRTDRVQKLRDALPALKTDATAALERLEQKLYNAEPVDDRAAELAEDVKAIDRAERLPEAPGKAEEMRRIATALRDMRAPDAVAQQAEAVRSAEHAARATSENAPDAAQARRDAARATEALAERLNDSSGAAARAEALAKAQEGLNRPDASRDPRAAEAAQHAIADDVAALPTDSPRKQAAVRAAQDAAALANRAVNRPDAAPSAEQLAEARAGAAKAIEALAQAVRAEVHPPAANAEARPSPRDQAKALADRQKALAQKAKDLEQKANEAPKDDKAAAAKIEADLAAMRHEQEAIAAEALAVRDPLPSNSQPRREAEARRDEARAAANQADGAMANANPAKAAEKAQAAAGALERLAQSLPEKVENPRPVPADPELAIDADQAREARHLARQERELRERLQAILGERVPPQEKLRDETVALGRKLADLRDGTRDVSQKAQNPANTAADLLQNHAPAAQNEGMQNLATGKPDPARDAQRRAAEHLERAAQQAEDLAGALRSEVAADAMAEAEHGEGEANEPSKADLGSARDAQREASHQLAQAKETPGDAPSAKSAQAAAQSMKQAAKGLRAAASPQRGKSSRAERSKARSTESANADPKEGETGRDEAHLAELKDAIKAKTGRAWGELPGHLRSEILQMSQGKYREDYARLIQIYFREIASGRDDETGAKP
jgi:hypothetical protein